MMRQRNSGHVLSRRRWRNRNWPWYSASSRRQESRPSSCRGRKRQASKPTCEGRLSVCRNSSLSKSNRHLSEFDEGRLPQPAATGGLQRRKATRPAMQAIHMLSPCRAKFLSAQPGEIGPIGENGRLAYVVATCPENQSRCALVTSRVYPLPTEAGSG